MCSDETKIESVISNASAQCGVICCNGLDTRAEEESVKPHEFLTVRSDANSILPRFGDYGKKNGSSLIDTRHSSNGMSVYNSTHCPVWRGNER